MQIIIEQSYCKFPNYHSVDQRNALLCPIKNYLSVIYHELWLFRCTCGIGELTSLGEQVEDLNKANGLELKKP